MDNSQPHAIEHFRTAEHAERVTILTVLSPFRAQLDRFTVIETQIAEAGVLLTCTACALDAPLNQGRRQPLSPGVLAAFDRALVAAWPGDDRVPDGAHDGVTLIIERAAAGRYRRVRMVDPPENSAHGRLLAAWKQAFPVVRQVL
ncbi:MAG: hypothetical protein JW966_03850 [Anaerolineae bacterium]|nr:hypothetical protein [Anaerolineae bacterium]